ncbi:hypothetical protein DVA67_007270 [Solirubrobacter sp. CPCC 204708]|nr:hypothetical protein [Solirubrobacter deserti]
MPTASLERGAADTEQPGVLTSPTCPGEGAAARTCDGSRPSRVKPQIPCDSEASRWPS